MPIPRETLEELTFLRQRNAELEAMVADRRKADQDSVTALRRNTGLSVGRALILAALAQGGIMSREQLMVARYGDCDACDMGVRNIDSIIKRLRKALARVSPKVTITSHYGFGYELAGESLVTVRRMIKGRD